jgi:hypothetical protein
MLPTKTHRPTLSLVLQEQANDRMELSRLMAAAVVSPKFCNMLLKDPEGAIKTGYQGEKFSFSNGECDLILSIRSNSLADLAGQLSRTFDEDPHINLNSSVRKTDFFIL